MNKKILISLSVIGAVAAIAIGGTIAYFSDTETSMNNTFAAGRLDLIFQADDVKGQWTDVNGNPLFGPQAIPFPGDMKPGDTGERTVRLWVDNNPSCGRVTVDVKEDLENSCTEPEDADETGDDCTPLGELNDEINWIIWLDNGGTGGVGKCNNRKDAGEDVLVRGRLTGDQDYYFGDLPTSEATANCYGVAYCFGTWNETYTTCDGTNVDNKSQTDSFKADIIINALQKRHQFGETCPFGPVPPVQLPPIDS